MHFSDIFEVQFVNILVFKLTLSILEEQILARVDEAQNKN